jgi:hypothetical protein
MPQRQEAMQEGGNVRYRTATPQEMDLITDIVCDIPVAHDRTGVPQ